MNKQKVAGLGVALVAGLMLGVTVLGGAIAGPKGDVPGATAVEQGVSASSVSGTAIIIEATAVENGTLPELNDPNMHGVEGAGTVTLSSDGLIIISADSKGAQMKIDANGTITDSEGNVVGSAAIMEATRVEVGKLPELPDPNDPALGTLQGSGTVTAGDDGTIISK